MATIGERFVRWLGGLTQADVDVIRNRAFEAGMEAADSGNDEPVLYTADGKSISTGYRRVGHTPRDLSSWSQERAIEAVYRLWNTNPLALALTEIVVDFVVGDQVRVVAEHPELQAVLDAFLADPVNDLVLDGSMPGAGLQAMGREIGLFGEHLMLLFVRDGADKGLVADGRVRIGTVDPSQIHSLITDNHNRRDVLAVKLKDAQGGENGPVYALVRADGARAMLEGARDLRKYAEMVGKAERISEAETQIEFAQRLAAATWRVVRGRAWEVRGENGLLRVREAEQPQDYPVLGQCMLFQTNKISTGMRGRPDLLQMIDWLDRFDQLFFDGAEHVAILNMFSWDLKIEGGSETAPEKELNLNFQANKVAKMKPGSVYSHNEKAALSAVNPDLKTTDLEVIIRQLRVFIAGGARVPEHWIAEGGYTNRSTSEEMGKPTYRMLTRRQGLVRLMLRRLCQFQVDVLVQMGLMDPELPLLDDEGRETGETQPAREAFSVQMADINVEDTNLAARSLGIVAQAVMPLMAGGYITNELGLELLSAVADLMGVQIDVEAELAKLEEDGVGSVGADELGALADYLKKMRGDEEPVEGDKLKVED